MDLRRGRRRAEMKSRPKVGSFSTLELEIYKKQQNTSWALSNVKTMLILLGIVRRGAREGPEHCGACNGSAVHLHRGGVPRGVELVDAELAAEEDEDLPPGAAPGRKEIGP